MNIVILLSAGRDPRSGIPRPVTVELQAIALARRIDGASVTGLHAGRHDPAIGDTLAHGLHTVTLLRLTEADDPVPSLVAELLATRPALILAGRAGSGGTDSGMLPYRLAHACGLPIAADAISLEPDDAGLTVTQSLPRGARRRLIMTLPAVITIHPAAPPALPYVWRLRQRGVITERPGVPAPIQREAETRPYRPRPKLIEATTTPTATTVMTAPTPAEAAAAIRRHLRKFRPSEAPDPPSLIRCDYDVK